MNKEQFEQIKVLTQKVGKSLLSKKTLYVVSQAKITRDCLKYQML